MEEFIKTFHIDWKLMLAQTFNFGLVFLVFYFIVAKPLGKLIKNRTEEIETGLADAIKNSSLLERTKKEYTEVLTKARMEAQKIFDEGKKEALIKKDDMLTEAKIEVETLITKGKKTLEIEKAKMVEEAKKELAGLAILAAQKIIEEKK